MNLYALIALLIAAAGAVAQRETVFDEVSSAHDVAWFRD
jgi:hypothetical protein